MIPWIFFLGHTSCLCPIDTRANITELYLEELHARHFASSFPHKISEDRIAATLDSGSAVILNKGANLFTAFSLVFLLFLLTFYRGKGKCIGKFPSKSGPESGSFSRVCHL